MSMLYINLTCPGVANENEKYDFFFHFMIYVLFKSVVLFDVFCYIIGFFLFSNCLFTMCYFSYVRINQTHSALSASIRQGIPEIK
jgi:hypothetical protein